MIAKELCTLCGVTSEHRIVEVDGGSWGDKIKVKECPNCKLRTHINNENGV